MASFPTHAGNPGELLSIADRALYRANHEGHNRVCVAALREEAETDRG